MSRCRAQIEKCSTQADAILSKMDIDGKQQMDIDVKQMSHTRPQIVKRPSLLNEMSSQMNLDVMQMRH